MFYAIATVLAFMAGLNFDTQHQAALIYLMGAFVMYGLAMLASCECPMNDD